MVDKNTLLNISNATMNAGVMKILRYTSIAVKRFGGKYKNRANFYSGKIGITYNQWEDDLAKYRVPSKGDIGLTHADLPRGSTLEQFIPLTEHGCASELISKQQMKQAMGSPERLAEFVADKIEVAAARAAYEIDKKFFTDITKTENYRRDDTEPDKLGKAPAIFLNDQEEYGLKIDENGITNIRKLISTVKSTAAVMKRPTNKFNQMKLISSALDLKRIGVIISEELFGQLEDHYGNTFNLEYAKLERMFAWVEVAPIHEYVEGSKHKGVHIILITEDGYICELDDEADSGWDESRKIFQESWWYQWVYAYQDLALGKNAAMFAVNP